ncbi:MAG: class I SAM-dependent methyltransferase [Candidatus Theseobacter exili]|nr:class I SAM-dependent methyltransferase [Candidatus Theseobacter exili]
MPRRRITEEIGIKPGFYVVDYGCGPGSYVVPLSEMVGEKGRVYTLDINPLAIWKINTVISKKKLGNVEAICSDCKTGLADGSIDAVILYDVLHTLSDPDGVLTELNRVLKPDGMLSFLDHKTAEDKLVEKITADGMFRLATRGKRTYTFKK